MDTFIEAEAQAARVPDIETYARWQRRMELRYDVLPLWWWNEQQRKGQYVSYVKGAVEWRERESVRNARTVAFFDKLTGGR